MLFWLRRRRVRFGFWRWHLLCFAFASTKNFEESAFCRTVCQPCLSSRLLQRRNLFFYCLMYMFDVLAAFGRWRCQLLVVVILSKYIKYRAHGRSVLTCRASSCSVRWIVRWCTFFCPSSCWICHICAHPFFFYGKCRAIDRCTYTIGMPNETFEPFALRNPKILNTLGYSFIRTRSFRSNYHEQRRNDFV